MPLPRFTRVLVLSLFTLAPNLAEATAPVGGAGAGPVPLEAFFARAEIMAPAVSPDGMRVAFLAPVADRYAVVVFDLASGKVAPVGRAAKGEISGFYWKGNDHIVFSVEPDDQGYTIFMAVDLKTKEVHTIGYVFLVDPLPFDPAHVILIDLADPPGLFLASVAGLPPGRLFGWDKDTYDWQADGDGSVRFRARYDRDHLILEVRRDDKSLWKPMESFRGGSGLADRPVKFRGFTADNQRIVVTREEPDGRAALLEYDIRGARWGEPLVRCDTPITAVRLSPRHDRVEGVRYGPDGRTEKWLDARLEQIAAKLRATFPAQYDVKILSSDDREEVFVLAVEADVCPPVYYLLDQRGKGQLVELGRAYPALAPGRLRPMQPITYHARDGLLIHGYLTLPAGAEGKRVPLVLYPHDGPYGRRNYWGFDNTVQFLASRGYAVLQPNYRGSGGYGESFLLAGRHEWGRKMQDDLTDAVHWAIDQGIADPHRVGIFGVGYGGCAALAGAEFTPDLFCCAANEDGPSDLSLVSSWQQEMWEGGKTFYREMVGDDKVFFASCSPMNSVDRIKIPTLHAYSDNEQLVKNQHWAPLERQLKKFDKVYEYVPDASREHRYGDEVTRINFYRHLEAFFGKYLAADKAGGTP